MAAKLKICITVDVNPNKCIVIMTVLFMVNAVMLHFARPLEGARVNLMSRATADDQPVSYQQLAKLSIALRLQGNIYVS